MIEPVYNDIEKMKAFIFAIWMVSVLAVAFGYQAIKGVVVFILTKLYEFFIQNNPVH